MAETMEATCSPSQVLLGTVIDRLGLLNTSKEVNISFGIVIY